MMDSSFLPLAEVHLSVEDVAIKFEDEEEEIYNDTSTLCQNGLYEDPEASETLGFLKETEDFREVGFHFLPTKADLYDSERHFQCEDCGNNFIQNEHLRNHKQTHTGERPFECDSCEKTFAKHFDLKRHKKRIHDALTTFFICEECGRTFSRKDRLKSHLLTHKIKSVKTESSEENVAALLKTFTCQACGRTYCRLDNLKRHMQKHCEKFGSDKFNSSNVINLRSDSTTETGSRGINIHFMCSNEIETKGDNTLRSFPCEFCGRLFIRKEHLKNHERTHTGERPFKCNQCDRSFTKRYVMTRHIQNVHGINPKIHKCNECDRLFSRTDHLKTHMKIHILAAVRDQEQYKLHKCGICEGEFDNSHNLKEHMKIHLIDDV